jgi:hypothetical protein
LDNVIKSKIKKELKRNADNIKNHEFIFELVDNGETPTLGDRDSANALLQQFYNGIETVFNIILKDKGENITNGTRWHSDVLNAVFNVDKEGNSILNNQYKEQLKEYMSIRHKIRHSYTEDIKWDNVEILINNLKIMFNNINNDVNKYIDLHINDDNIKITDCKKHHSASNELKVLIENKTVVTEIEKYNEKIKKLHFKDEKGKDVFVLQQKTNIGFEFLHFDKNFSKESALTLLNQLNTSRDGSGS